MFSMFRSFNPVDANQASGSCWCCCAFFNLFLAAFVGWALWPGKAKPASPCKVPFKEFVHRGDVSKGPENTINSTLGALRDVRNYGSEFDILVTKDGTHFPFHDDDMERLTGLQKKVKDVTWAEIENLTLMKELNYRLVNGVKVPFEYELSSRGIVSLDTFLKAVCKEYPNAAFNFDNKRQNTQENVKKLVKIVADSDCTPGENQYVFATGYPWEAAWFRKELDANPKLASSKVSVYIHPNTLPLGLGVELMLRTRFYSWYAPHDFLTLHYQVYEQNWGVIEGYWRDGWCLGIYGANQSTLQDWYDKVDMMIVDVPSDVLWSDWASIGVSYQASSMGYYTLNLLIVFFILLSWQCIANTASKYSYGSDPEPATSYGATSNAAPSVVPAAKAAADAAPA